MARLHFIICTLVLFSIEGILQLYCFLFNDNLVPFFQQLSFVLIWMPIVVAGIEHYVYSNSNDLTEPTATETEQNATSP